MTSKFSGRVIEFLAEAFLAKDRAKVIATVAERAFEDSVEKRKQPLR